MKKLGCIFFAVILILSFAVCTFAATADKDADYYYYTLAGDIDEDGVHGLKDVLAILYSVVNDNVSNMALADANGDGKINRADLLRLAKYLLDPDNVTLG